VFKCLYRYAWRVHDDGDKRNYLNVRRSCNDTSYSPYKKTRLSARRALSFGRLRYPRENISASEICRVRDAAREPYSHVYTGRVADNSKWRLKFESGARSDVYSYDYSHARVPNEIERIAIDLANFARTLFRRPR